MHSLVTHSAGADTAWHVLHTRPRCEKKVRACCEVYSIPSYLPLRAETRTYQRRKVTFYKPLFPGYVFASFAPGQRAAVFGSGHVARVIPVLDQEQFVREIEQIRAALAADPGLIACRAVVRGALVRIKTGPFQGLEGVVTSLKGRCRVVLNVAMINQGVAVEVDISDIERL